MFNLGLMYEKRRGVSSDAPEEELLEATRECYEAAAEAGVTKAMVRPFPCVASTKSKARSCRCPPSGGSVRLFQWSLLDTANTMTGL